MLVRVYAAEFPSVCHTLCVKMDKRFIEVLSPPNSPIILVFRH